MVLLCAALATVLPGRFDALAQRAEGALADLAGKLGAVKKERDQCVRRERAAARAAKKEWLHLLSVCGS